jgi:hypothetical protein
VIADVHGFYGNRIGSAVAAELIIDTCLNGGEKSIFVRRVHFEVENGGEEKSIEEHQEEEISAYSPDNREGLSKRHRFFLIV